MTVVERCRNQTESYSVLYYVLVCVLVVVYVLMCVLVCVLVCVCVSVLALLLIVGRRCWSQAETYSVVLNPEEDVRENIIQYDEEGVGELYCRLLLANILTNNTIL